jgi:Bacterial Ig-like domain (group 2)
MKKDMSEKNHATNSFKLLAFIVLLMVCALGENIFSVYSQSNDSAGNQQTGLEIPTATPCCETSLHTLFGSYSIEDNFTAKLLLNNKGGEPLDVQPTLYNAQGQELPFPTITVDPQSFKFVDLRELAANGGESYKKGTLKLIHGGVDLVLGAQIYSTDEEHSISFEERLFELGRFDSRKQEAIWWMPSKQTQVQVVLSNTTDEPLTVTGKLSRKPHITGNVQTFEFTPHETKVLNLKQDFVGGNQFSNADLIGLSLEHTSVKNDALLARVWVSEESRGYSNIVRFSNPNGGKSQEYHGAGFQIEDIGDIQFKPIIIARNIGTQDAIVTAKVPYTRANGTKGTVTLPQETVKSGWFVKFDPEKILSRVEQENIKVAGLEIKYNTAPGSIVVSAQSISNDRNHVFRVLMNDPLTVPNASGGYPWRIDDTSKTLTFIKNVANYEQDYVAYLVWENEAMYSLGMNSIAAHETVEIDIKKLRDEQIPDEFGRKIPLTVSGGQIHWSIRRKDNLAPDDALAMRSLIGRSQQVDMVKGIVTDYVCVSCCPGSYRASSIQRSGIPNTTTQDTLPIGQTLNYIGVEEQSSCSTGTTAGPPQFVVKSATWSSSNTAVATVNSITGQVTAVAPGTATILATWQARSYVAIFKACQQVAQFNVMPGRTVFVPEVSVTNVMPETPDTITKKITQIIGNPYIIHLATPKGTGNVTLLASISPDTAANRNLIDWEGATEDPANPLKATLSKATASKNIVNIKYNGNVIKELRVWVVWATITSADVPIEYFGNVNGVGSPGEVGAIIRGGYTFTHTIQPPVIITDFDRPDFSGSNTIPPPGGNHPIFGDPLSGGANKKWDNSRQIRLSNINPNGLLNGDFAQPAFPNISYPANDVEGNDDRSVGDETNDPYTNTVLTGSDRPQTGIKHSAGIDSDTYEARLQFKEFTRLEIEGTWYRISDYYLWRIHLKFVKAGGVWTNNLSDKALDNNGF